MAHPEGLLISLTGIFAVNTNNNKKQRTKSPFKKPAFSFEQQLNQLKQRSLIVDDDEQALHYLSHINYYRLAAYCLPFESNHTTHTFKKDVHFNDVLNSYIFDRELRLLLLDAIERIEVSVRTQLAYVLSHRYGSHPHLNPSCFFNPITYERSIAKLEGEVRRSGEDFIKHLSKKYEELLPPIWAVVELMTMGSLSKWYDNLKERKDRKAIADVYDIDEKNLRSFLHHLSTVRNLCAHHARLWNRDFTVTFSLPTKRPATVSKKFNTDQHANRKIYNTLIMLSYLMHCTCKDSLWKTRIIDLIKTHNINTTAMGFPNDWISNGL